MTEDEIREELLKLTVGKGGKPSHRTLTPDAEIGFYERSRREREAENDEFPYVLLLSIVAEGKRCEEIVRLRRHQVYTRTKGMWSRDCVWRLTPESATTFAAQIAAVLRRG